MQQFLNRFKFSVLFSILMLSFVFGQDDKDFKFSGNIFYDYMHGISSDGPRTRGSENGFMFRRAYITITKKIDDNFTMRYRLDADRKADDKLRPFLKNLYLQWENLVPASALYIGMSSTPTKEVSEAVWGYRGLSKTAWDGFNDATGIDNTASSAAVGLALKGSLAENVTYHSMIANGNGYSKPESNKYKRIYTSVSANLSDFIVEGYFDFEGRTPDDDNLTLKGFAGYAIDGMAFGAEYYIMTMGGGAAGGDDLNLTALSLFGRYDVMENITAILRYDMYDPDTDTNDNETGLIIAALDYRPAKGISVIPNINYYMNSLLGSGSDEADIIGYLTFLWSFK